MCVVSIFKITPVLANSPTRDHNLVCSVFIVAARMQTPPVSSFASFWVTGRACASELGGMAGAADADVVLAFCKQFACVDETSPVVASLRERVDAVLPLDTNVSGGSKNWRDRVVAFRAAVRQLPSVERGLQCTVLLILEDMEKEFLGKTVSSWRRHMGLIAVLFGASFHKLAVNWELTKKLPRDHASLASHV